MVPNGCVCCKERRESPSARQRRQKSLNACRALAEHHYSLARISRDAHGLLAGQAAAWRVRQEYEDTCLVWLVGLPQSWHQDMRRRAEEAQFYAEPPAFKFLGDQNKPGMAILRFNQHRYRQSFFAKAQSMKTCMTHAGKK